MKIMGLTRCRGIPAAAVLWAMSMAYQAEAQWPQWGGPDRNFMVETSGLADSWPNDGPRRLWNRELGDGYSSIAYDNGVLYTMYRKEQTDDNEYTIALDANSGKTIWERQHPSPVPEDGRRFPGPNTTPLVSGERIYTIGRNAVMHCYNKKDGKILWKHDLVAEFGAGIPGWGYSSSPIAYRDTVIAALGRPEDEHGEDSSTGDEAKTPPSKQGRSLVAFDQKTGMVVWQSQDFRFRFSSPILINLGGKDQLIVLPHAQIVSVDPASGELLWRHRLAEDREHVMTPIWNGEDLLFCASGETGRVIRLTLEDGKTVPEELWASRKIAGGLATPVRIGDLIVASKTGQVPLLLGVDIKTGKRAWAQRGFATTTLVHGDGKIILLDEQGQLALTTATPEGLTVHSKWQIPEWAAQTFAAPTLAGTMLYVRDRTNVMAFDLGRS